MKSVTTEFKSRGLHEKHVVATWNLGSHLNICFQTQRNEENPVSRWPVAGQVAAGHSISSHRVTLVQTVGSEKNKMLEYVRK